LSYFSKLASQKKKGAVMALMIKKAETLFERFENSLEYWADKIL